MPTPDCECSETRAQPRVGQEGMEVTKRAELRSQLGDLVPHGVVEQDWQEAIRHIPVDLEATARESGALLRRRGVRRAEDLLRMALTYALCDWSLRTVAAWACLQGWAELSDTALMWRLQGARVWLGLLVAAWVLRNRSELACHPVRLRLIDASVINGPRSKGTDWRLHVSLDLGQGRLEGVEITDNKGAETLVRHPVQAGDIEVADRGYAHPEGIGRVLAGGGKLVVRITLRNLRLYDDEGVKLDLLEWLRQAPEGEAVERAVRIKTENGTFSLRLIAKRLDRKAAEAARRRLRRRSSRNSRKPKEESLEAAGFLVVMSNLEAQRWCPEHILALYRLRWQVEIAFKRLKGVLHLDHLRAQDPDLAQSYLLAKLLGALMVDRLSQAGSTGSIEGLEPVERPVSPWRWTVLWSDALRRAVQGTVPLAQFLAALPRLRRYLCDTPRRRIQQYALGRRLVQLLAGLIGTAHDHADPVLQPLPLC